MDPLIAFQGEPFSASALIINNKKSDPKTLFTLLHIHYFLPPQNSYKIVTKHNKGCSVVSVVQFSSLQ